MFRHSLSEPVRWAIPARYDAPPDFRVSKPDDLAGTPGSLEVLEKWIADADGSSRRASAALRAIGPIKTRVVFPRIRHPRRSTMPNFLGREPDRRMRLD